MKNKLMGVLTLCLLFSSCALRNETYVSKRHPQENKQSTEEKSYESTEIKYSKANDTSLDQSTDQKEIETNQENNDDNESVDGVEYEAASTLNMRLAPSTNSGVVVEVPGGAKVIKIGENGQWTRATYNGYTGYILTELLREVQ
ncbi:MAG: SH3 domain-containing protein [Peptoniphilaceae bacterium]|nr:SH3 domain-containing protein [Peptoniphilaceae bacterium]MDY6018999.1 SH3 domain-containing protein [Anaerococcus sp.]